MSLVSFIVKVEEHCDRLIELTFVKLHSNRFRQLSGYAVDRYALNEWGLHLEPVPSAHKSLPFH